MTLPFVDQSRPTISRGTTVAASRALPTAVWSPDVPTPARWPLVVFAPGFRVGPSAYEHLLRAWAAHGYVVAAPSFPLADPASAGAAIDEGDLDNEPADLDFVVAALTGPTSPLASLIDPVRIAVAGHSDGAEVALAVAQQGNPVIKAVVAMAGQPVVPHQTPDPPLLAIQGSQDAINPPPRSAAVYDGAPGPRFLLTLVGAGHLAAFAGDSRWQAVVEAVTIDFLDHYLAGTMVDDAKLTTDAAQPGLSTLR